MPSHSAKFVALAAVAHPDDIEFMMAGTLALLKKAGVEIHMINLANGCCGSLTHSREETAILRRREAMEAAKVIDAEMHPPLFDDLAIFFDAPSLAKVAAVVREAKPNIVFTHSPQDYMEDHQNTCRLVTTAVFSHGIPNFHTHPPRQAYEGNVAVYHARPHGSRDPLRKRLRMGHYVDISSVVALKREMLSQHRSQKEWLDATQGMNAYLEEMEAMDREIGRMSGHFKSAEGFRRHLHLGYGPSGFDPLRDLLQDQCLVDPEYEKWLDSTDNF